MAAQDDSQERTEEATPKRLREAVERGQVPRSRELNTLGVLLAGATGLTLLGPAIVENIGAVMRGIYQPHHAVAAGPEGLLGAFTDSAQAMLLALMPFLAVMALTAAIVPVLLGGWTLSGKAVSFQWERIDPIKGLGRIFSLKGLVELLKALAKFTFIGAVAGAWLWHAAPEFMVLGSGRLGEGTDDAGGFVMAALFAATTPMLLVAAIDVPFQIWDHARQLRMSRKELKDEMKETEGSPELKARIRRQQQELSQRRMMEAVPTADVIITNPTHYAAALEYKPDTMRAPVLIAKGADELALRIREVGAAHNVPVVESPLLARALYYNTALDAEVPSSLYVAVAKVLAYLFRLRADGRQISTDPLVVTDVEIPDGLRTQ